MEALNEPTLSEVFAALQALGDAVTADDKSAYRKALKQAETAELTKHQIADAHQYRATRRLLNTTLAPVSFNWHGEHDGAAAFEHCHPLTY